MEPGPEASSLINEYVMKTLHNLHNRLGTNMKCGIKVQLPLREVRVAKLTVVIQGSLPNIGSDPRHSVQARLKESVGCCSLCTFTVKLTLKLNSGSASPCSGRVALGKLLNLFRAQLLPKSKN